MENNINLLILLVIIFSIILSILLIMVLIGGYLFKNAINEIYGEERFLKNGKKSKASRHR